MPLLGRHKSLPGSSTNQSSDARSKSVAHQPPPLVCESPLFGVRRQLPVATQHNISNSSEGDHSPTARPTRKGTSLSASSSAAAGSVPGSMSLSSRLSSSSSSSTSSSSQSSRRTNQKEPLQKQLSRDGQLGSTLSSIPKQISRQQIHYAFSMMDTNSDGLIDLRDLSQMLSNLGVPIDEAILSHVMAPVSKRGDHRISESEFLDWIGNFIQVLDSASGETQTTATSCLRRRQVAAGRSPATRSNNYSSKQQQATSPAGQSSSLVAQSPEAQFVINQQLSKRRGSGSGLALVRSLASSASGAGDIQTRPATGKDDDQDDEGHLLDETTSITLAAAKRERQLQDQLEARRDLKAAFCVFDLDGDGFITIDEVQQGLKLLGESWSQAELDQLFSQCNSNKTTLKQRPDLTTTASNQQQRISIDDFVHLLL